jgi:hypothetical protein
MYRSSIIVTLAATLAACSTSGSIPNRTLSPENGSPRTTAVDRAAAVPVVGGCQIFPAPSGTPNGNSWWNQDISKYPLDPKSSDYIAHLGGSLHPDFGHEAYYGIPINIVPATQPKVPVRFNYSSESDPGPYPIPPNAQVEGAPLYHSGDLHVLVLQQGTCKLYETWNSHEHNNGKSWTAGSGAIFNLNSNKLRPNGWTSADAAGLPIFPALIKCDEVKAGAINHALRVTFNNTYYGFIHPATHYAGISNTHIPPMGERLRLKASFDVSRFNGVSRIILTAMKKYGMYVADNGSNWYFQGQGGKEAACWNDNELNQLKTVPGTAFEFIQTGKILRISGP